jgi:hypothetical protein
LFGAEFFSFGEFAGTDVFANHQIISIFAERTLECATELTDFFCSQVTTPSPAFCRLSRAEK